MKITEIINLDPFRVGAVDGLSSIGDTMADEILKKYGLDDKDKDSSSKDSSNTSKGTAGSGFTNFKSGGNRVSPSDIKSYLKTKGLDDNQIAGLIVSIKWESGFKPGAFVKSDNHQGPSGGFFGFHDPKFDGRGNFSDMVSYCGGPDKWQTNWQKQLDFALKGPHGREYVATKFKSPGEAAAWWVVNYEKPADTRGQAIARAKDATQYA